MDQGPSNPVARPELGREYSLEGAVESLAFLFLLKGEGTSEESGSHICVVTKQHFGPA